MSQASNREVIELMQGISAVPAPGDRLYDLLYQHQLAFYLGRYYYCWESARIYNQYKNFDLDKPKSLDPLLPVYYATIRAVRNDINTDPNIQKPTKWQTDYRRRMHCG